MSNPEINNFLRKYEEHKIREGVQAGFFYEEKFLICPYCGGHDFRNTDTAFNFQDSNKLHRIQCSSCSNEYKFRCDTVYSTYRRARN